MFNIFIIISVVILRTNKAKHWQKYAVSWKMLDPQTIFSNQEMDFFLAELPTSQKTASFLLFCLLFNEPNREKWALMRQLTAYVWRTDFHFLLLSVVYLGLLCIFFFQTFDCLKKKYLHRFQKKIIINDFFVVDSFLFLYLIYD